ncbi:hypothetical protein HMSSN036_14880 [Paenibacillus macerans]|nr:hypothetical protein HMSSN036_14880 [Paenibacillus macerans]
MVLGILLALVAGSLVGIQNIFNNKVNEHTGTWTTTTLVLGLGFAASFVIGLLLEGKICSRCAICSLGFISAA